MSDTKRFLVWIGVIAWAFLSLVFPVNAQQCSEDQYAANTIIIKKRGGSVPAGAALACNTTTPAWSQWTDDADGFNVEGKPSQKIKNSTAVQICKVDLYLKLEAVGPESVTVQVWSANEAGGTQYGGTSSTVNLTERYTWVTATFTWDNTSGHEYPNPSGDFFLTVVGDGGSDEFLWAAIFGVAAYEDTNYDVWRGGSDQNWDARFNIYTMQ